MDRIVEDENETYIYQTNNTRPLPASFPSIEHTLVVSWFLAPYVPVNHLLLCLHLQNSDGCSDRPVDMCLHTNCDI